MKRKIDGIVFDTQASVRGKAARRGRQHENGDRTNEAIKMMYAELARLGSDWALAIFRMTSRIGSRKSES